MASLTKRPRNKNKPWSMQWYDGAGKRREAAFRTNREAKDFKIKLEHDQREGTFVDPRLGREPFGDAARRWFTSLAVAPETGSTRHRARRMCADCKIFSSVLASDQITGASRSWTRGVTAGSVSSANASELFPGCLSHLAGFRRLS